MMMTCKEKALEWGLSVRTINNFCKQGKIPGAIKLNNRWQIPDDAEKPNDGRITSGKYITTMDPQVLKSLPIGISDYARAQSQYYYVDKTLLIKEFLDRKPLVSLFIRPQRFGKTLNMDMLRVFLKFQKKIPVNILPEPIYGNAARLTVLIRENILLFFSHLKT